MGRTVRVRFKYLVNSILSACVLVVLQSAVAVAATNQCKLPPGLREEVSKKYPGTTLVSLADLEEYNRSLYQKDHGTRCPGLVKVDFYGDGKPTWALALVTANGVTRKTELVVARQVGTGWTMRSLERESSGSPVIWSEGPGEYKDVHGEKTIRARWPVIIFCGYESWATLYAWTGKAIKKIWIAD